MIRIDPTLNSLEVLVVTDRLDKRGIKSYTLAPGNNCIWAYYGPFNEYYIFSKGLLTDIQID